MELNPNLDQQMASLEEETQDENQAPTQVPVETPQPEQAVEPPVPAALPEVGSVDELSQVEPAELPPEIERARTVAGVDDFPIDRTLTVPEKVVLASTIERPRVGGMGGVDPEVAQDYYARFGKLDDEVAEQSNRASIESASHFYIPQDIDEFAKMGYSTNPTPANSMAIQFPAGVDTAEDRIAYMASQNAVGYSITEPGQQSPYEGITVRPRYMQELISKTSEVEGDGLIDSFATEAARLVWAEKSIEGGQTEMSAILTRMGVTGPAQQLSVLALEESGEISERTGLVAGGRTVLQMIVDAWNVAKKGLTVVGALNTPGGGVMNHASKHAELIRDTAIAEQAIKDDPKNQGMFRVEIDPETGAEVRELRPEFMFDYAAALEAHGFDKDGAQEFIAYSYDMTDRGLRLLGEEAIFGAAAFGIRYGLAAGQAILFSRWIDRTYGSLEDAVRSGLTGGQLAAEFIEQIPDSKLSNWARSMAANSMRISADTGRGGVFSVGEQLAAQSKRMSDLSSRLIGLKNARTQARTAGKPTSAIDKELAEVRQEIKTTAANMQSAREEAVRSSWIGDTIRTDAYGIVGASFAGQVMTNYFGGEENAVLPEILGFMTGHTLINLGVTGTKSLLKSGARGLDNVIQVAGATISGRVFRPFEKAGAYSEIDTLSRKERRVLESLQGLRGASRAQVTASATYRNELRTTLANIKTKDGTRIFEDEFLQETLGTITALNVLQLAEVQLQKGISVGDIKDMGDGFYAKEQIYSQKQEVLIRLDRALQALLPARSSPEATDTFREFVDQLDGFVKDQRSALRTSHEEVMTELNNRQALIQHALRGETKALQILGVPVGEGIDPRVLGAKLQELDDSLFVTTMQNMGHSPEESLKALNERILERTKSLEKEAQGYMSAVTGPASQGGPATHATNLFYTIRTGHQSASSARYTALFNRPEVKDDVLMSVTSVYDFFKKTPGAFTPSDIPMTISDGAVDAAGQGVKGGFETKMFALFEDAASRTMNQFEDKITKAAVANGKDPEEALNVFYTSLRIDPNATALQRWEAVRAGLRQESTKEVNQLFLEKFGGEGGVDALVAMEKRLPLAINVKEYHLIKRGVNAEVSGLFRKDASGALAQENLQLRDELQAAAVDPTTGFKRGLFSGNPQPASDIFQELKAADKYFQENVAERYLRGGPSGQVGKDLPKDRVPDLDIARSTGNVEPDKIYKVFLGDLEKTSVQDKSVALRVTNNAAQSFGVRLGDNVEGFTRPDVPLKEGEKPPRGSLKYTGADGKEYTKPEGAFVFIEGDPATDAFRSNLELHLIDEIRRSPGGDILRKLVIDGKLGAASPEARMEILRSNKLGEAYNPNLLLNSEMMFMLKKGDDGKYYEVPLINTKRVLQEISYDTVYHLDDGIRKHSDAALDEWDRVANRMRSEFKRRQETSEESYKVIEREIMNVTDDPRKYFQAQFDKGDAGSLDLNVLRTKIEERARVEAKQRGASDAEIEAAAKDALDLYDDARSRNFAEWVISKSEGTIGGIKASHVDPATGKASTIPVKGFKGQELLRIMGADGGPYAEENAAMFIKMLGDDDAARAQYDSLKAIGEWSVLQQQRAAGGRIEGVPTGLSIESWISRIYSINRGVVSPRYVGAEALLQSFRMQGLSLVEAMVSDPKLAAKVEKILISGEPLQSEQANYEFMQSLMVAGAMYLTRLEYSAEEVENTLGEERIEVPEMNMDQQMQQLTSGQIVP